MIEVLESFPVRCWQISQGIFYTHHQREKQAYDELLRGVTEYQQ